MSTILRIPIFAGWICKGHMDWSQISSQLSSKVLQVTREHLRPKLCMVSTKCTLSILALQSELAEFSAARPSHHSSSNQQSLQEREQSSNNSQEIGPRCLGLQRTHPSPMTHSGWHLLVRWHLLVLLTARRLRVSSLVTVWHRHRDLRSRWLPRRQPALDWQSGGQACYYDIWKPDPVPKSPLSCHMRVICLSYEHIVHIFGRIRVISFS